MQNNVGMVKPELTELPQVSDRMTFIYLEHCVINREDSAIKVTDLDGDVYIPAAAITTLLIGPGVRDVFNGKVPSDFSGMVRRRLRDEIVKLHLLERMVHDIKYLLSDSADEDVQQAVYLWDNICDKVENFSPRRRG